MDEDMIKRLGRVIVKDDRDEKYPMEAALPAEMPGVDYKYWWTSGWWGDQGLTPHCVAYSWLHWVEDGPVTHFYEDREIDPTYKVGAHDALFNPETIYKEAQVVDQWPGEDYDGTSVRAGAKILQKMGVIKEYRWSWDFPTLKKALLTTGPVVVGSWWYSDMFYPGEDGFITPTGDKAGGHAYVLNGINVDEGFVRLKNSWGRSWGKDGYAYIKFDDMARLLEDGGEACLALEKNLDS